MRVLKRALAIVYLAAAIVALGTLVCQFWGPYTYRFMLLMRDPMPRIVVTACGGVVAIGVLVSFFRLMFARREPSCVHPAGERNIEVTLAALSSCARAAAERDDRVISISFDASWGGDQTMRILDLLDEYNAKATFFLVGIWVDKYPELVKEIHDRGHEIGNHSSKHPHMTKISESRMRQELSDMAEKLEAITGEKPTLFRPPYGDYNNTVVSVARSEGYEVVQWSIDSLDWKNKGAADLIRRATTNVAPGDIVLFHNDSKYILDALPTILKTYHQQGFTLIPVGELLLEGNTTIDVQGRQHPAKAE